MLQESLDPINELDKLQAEFDSKKVLQQKEVSPQDSSVALDTLQDSFAKSKPPQRTWGDVLEQPMESAEKLWTGQLGVKPVTEYIKERTTVPESPPISKEYAQGFTENLKQSVYQMWGKMPSGDEIVRSMESGEPIPPAVQKEYTSVMKPKAGLKDVASSIGMTLVDFIAWLPTMATKFVKDPKGSLYHDPVGTLMLGHVASSMVKGKTPAKKPIEPQPMAEIPTIGEPPRMRGGLKKPTKPAEVKPIEPTPPSEGIAFQKGVLMPDGKFIEAQLHGEALNTAKKMGYDVSLEYFKNNAGWKVGKKIILESDIKPPDLGLDIHNLLTKYEPLVKRTVKTAGKVGSKYKKGDTLYKGKDKYTVAKVVETESFKPGEPAYEYDLTTPQGRLMHEYEVDLKAYSKKPPETKRDIWQEGRDILKEPELEGVTELHSGFNLKKEFKESLELLKTGKVAPIKPEGVVKPQTITPKSTELKLEPYSAPTTEPLIIVKQKGGGKMPVYHHEIEPFTRGTAKDLQRRGFKYTYENPIRVFEDYPTLKESVFDASQVANKNYSVEYTRFTKPRTSKIARWKKAIKKEGGSAERLGLWAIAEQKGGDKVLSALKKKRPEKLTPAEMKTYQEGRAMFDDLFKRINQARELAGKKPMGKVDNYYTWMRNFEALKELGIDPVFSDTQVVRKHLTDTAFQFAKERKLTKDVPVRTDYFNVLDNYLRLSLRYIHRTPVLAKGRAILEPYSFRALTKAGKPVTKQWSFKETYPRLAAWMTQWLDHYSGRKQPSLTWGMQALEKGAVKLNRNIGTAILTYNARSALIQPTALRNSYVSLGERFLLEGFAENLSLAKRRFAMDKSNVLRPRMIDVHIESALEGSIQKKFYTTRKKAVQVGIKPLQWLDMEAARATWLGAYGKAKKVMKLAEKEAIRYADDIVTRTQASAQASDIAPIQRTPFGKLATLFQTFVINEWNWLSKDVMGYKNPKMKAGQRAANVGRLVLSTAVANALFEGVLKIRSPFPAPEWAIIHAIEGGEDDALKLAGIAAKEMTEQLPVIGGGIRWAKPWRGMPLPAGHETIRRGLAMVPKMLDTGLAKINKEDVETLGRLLGIPGTGQIMKYLRRRKLGMSHAESIIGVRTDIGTTKKKQKYFH